MEEITENKDIDRETAFLAVVLESTILQMRILDSCCKLRQVQRALKDGAHTQDAQTKKLIKDRSRVSEISQRSLIEMIRENSWKSLERAVEVLFKDLTIKDVINSLHTELLQEREQAINILVNSRLKFEMDLRAADEKIALLKDNFEDAVINTRALLTYSEKWLNGRNEMIVLNNNIPRKRLPNLEHEERVHVELAKAYEIQTKELEVAVQHWEFKYADDIVKINKMVEEKKEQLKVTTARREELQKHFDLHEGEMRSWLTFKRERAARRAREERARLSATKIQAWWRGIMVRKGLGAFRYLRNIKKSPAKSKKKN